LPLFPRNGEAYVYELPRRATSSGPFPCTSMPMCSGHDRAVPGGTGTARVGQCGWSCSGPLPMCSDEVSCPGTLAIPSVCNSQYCPSALELVGIALCVCPGGGAVYPALCLPTGSCNVFVKLRLVDPVERGLLAWRAPSTNLCIAPPSQAAVQSTSRRLDWQAPPLPSSAASKPAAAPGSSSRKAGDSSAQSSEKESSSL
jgi:hypothetical protein